MALARRRVPLPSVRRRHDYLNGENKAGDYQALALVVVVFGAMAWLWQRSRRRFAAVSGEPAGIDQLAALALLPLALWLGSAVVRNTGLPFPAAWAAAALALVAFWFWAQRSTLSLDEEALIRLGRLALTSVLLSF
ncbi:MAG: hypothetical protein E6H64_01630, partial [Betaproteobacteria bacterium]